MEPAGPATGGELAPESSDQILGRAVMVGQVPGCEPGVVIEEHLLDGAHGIDAAVGAGNLPHSIQDAADLEIRGQSKAA